MTFTEALAKRTVGVLEKAFPGKFLKVDSRIQESRCVKYDFNAYQVYVLESDREVKYKTSIKSLNQYLS